MESRFMMVKMIFESMDEHYSTRSITNKDFELFKSQVEEEIRKRDSVLEEQSNEIIRLNSVIEDLKTTLNLYEKDAN